jgi:type VI protein secretion system component VasK
MAGFVIAVVAFALPFVLGLTGLGRVRVALGVGGVLALGWVISLAQNRATDRSGNPVIPLWLLVGLVVLLYAIWCGGLWVGVRLRRMRRATPG